MYGEPGTGKSSTIQAIATYLEKDIYYVSLSNVETNEELLMIFDYVNSETVGNAIIVFEDIDAMTHVVHKRNNIDSENKGMTISETSTNKLTLEYFLNILQCSSTDNTTI